MLISESLVALVTLSCTSEVLSIQWKKKPDIEQFKDTYWQVLRYVQQHGRIRFYSTDISLIGPFDMEQEAWLSKEYYPQVYASIQADIYAAVVFSECHFKALVSNYMASQLQPVTDFIHFNYFTDAAEAADWLAYMQKGQDQLLNA